MAAERRCAIRPALELGVLRAARQAGWKEARAADQAQRETRGARLWVAAHACHHGAQAQDLGGSPLVSQAAAAAAGVAVAECARRAVAPMYGDGVWGRAS